MNMQRPRRIPAFAAHAAAEIKTDYSSVGGAQILADRIARIWALHGHRVKTWVEPVSGTSGIGGSATIAYGVQSDLVNGLPRDIGGRR